MTYEEYLKRAGEYHAKFKTYNAVKKFLFRYYFKWYHRLEVIGLEHIPEGPAVIAANHTGGYDLDLLALSYFCHPAREVTPLITEAWHFTNSLWGKYFVGCGLPLFTRGGIRFEYLDPYLKPGGGRYPGLIGIFPEGNIKTLRERYALGKFYPGVVRIAHHYRVPIVPAAMVGFQEANPVFKIIPHDRAPDDIICLPFTLPFKLRVVFGPPVRLDEWHGKKLGKAEEYWIANTMVRTAVYRLMEKYARPSMDEVDVPMKKPAGTEPVKSPSR